ncbi:MAG: biotin carboxylase N-terminal domain-containing protein [Enterobacterales bacterium]|nr:biotin carboxylase N-terminal domain-containing protein [Enterobacterales bacterium]
MRARQINKLLIANRGEIACRIITTAKQMGIHCIAIYSEIDRQAKHSLMAEEAYCVGQASAQSSYLMIDKIIQIAKQSQANAIHPGYGFLSENAEFALACKDNNIIFVGPPIEAIEAMGSKSQAKEIMTKAKIPLVLGYHGENQEEDFLKQQAEQIGFPLLIKATAGGGGKGMRVVNSLQDFASLLIACKRESLSSFGDDRVLLERYLTQPRHIEIQIFADCHNNIVHCFERDCSLQRRHQKVLEEAPACNFSDDLRQQMAAVAIESARAIGYQGAGTVEFLLDSDESFYFMEMNTRLQVEHPITEMITGLDLVEWQLIVAMGQPLPLKQSEIQQVGHAFEARIYAEDPANGFLPSSGLVSFLNTPTDDPYIRIDSGIKAGDQISVYYDPMIAKLIVWDKTREGARVRLKNALSKFHLAGPTTNIDFLYQLVNHDNIKNAEYDTHFIEDNLEELCVATDFIDDEILCAISFAYLNYQNKEKYINNNVADPYSPWSTTDGWRLNESSQYLLQLRYNEQTYEVLVHYQSEQIIIEHQMKEFIVSGEFLDHEIILNLNAHKMKFDWHQQGMHFTLFRGSSIWCVEVLQKTNPNGTHFERSKFKGSHAWHPDRHSGQCWR